MQQQNKNDNQIRSKNVSEIKVTTKSNATGNNSDDDQMLDIFAKQDDSDEGDQEI